PKRSRDSHYRGRETAEGVRELDRCDQRQNLLHRRLHLSRDQRPGAGLDFHLAFGQRLFAYANANRKTDQLGILELYAGPFVAVVEDNIHAARGQAGIELFGAVHYLALRGDIERREANGVRRDAERPNDAVAIVALLDDGLQRAGHAYAVAAH